MLSTLFSLIITFGVVFGVPIWLFYYYLWGGKGKTMRRKIARMGVLRGQTYSQIVAQAGKPIKETIHPNGIIVGIWGHQGYNAVLQFKDDICQGVISETVF